MGVLSLPLDRSLNLNSSTTTLPTIGYKCLIHLIHPKHTYSTHPPKIKKKCDTSSRTRFDVHTPTPRHLPVRSSDRLSIIPLISVKLNGNCINPGDHLLLLLLPPAPPLPPVPSPSAESAVSGGRSTVPWPRSRAVTISARQLGQVRACWSHSSQHWRWKTCLHSVATMTSSFVNSAMHIQHSVG